VDKRQRAILVEVLTVITITVVAVAAMINFKDYVNRSEAITAMEHLSERVLEYKAKNGRVPPNSLIISIKGQLKGNVRLGELHYRGLWVNFDADPNEILAYAQKAYPSSVLGDGYIMLQLDGTVKWMGKKEFEELLASQQSDVETEMIQR